MGSNNTLLFQGTLTRSRVNGGQHVLPILQTLENLTNLVVREKTIPHGSVPTAIQFDGVTAKAVAVLTPKPVTVRYNADAVGVTIGSYDIRLDTNISALIIVNDDPANDVVLEVWIAS